MLKLQKIPDVAEMLPNVWLSSYMIRPSGAQKILSGMVRRKFDISTDIIDRCLVRIIHEGSMNAYAIATGQYFGHVETIGDTRQRENR